MAEPAAEIGGAAAVEIGRAVRPVGVAALRVALEQFERHQRIEEVTRAARVHTKPLGQLPAAERTAAEFAEETQFDGAQQDLGSPERKSDVEDAVRRWTWRS